MIKSLLKITSKGKPNILWESYCKLKRNESILQRITVCIWTNT